MYSTHQHSADSATIDPAALDSGLINSQTSVPTPSPRGTKRNRPSDTSSQTPLQLDPAGDDGNIQPRKRGRPMKSRPSDCIENSGQPTVSTVAQAPSIQTTESHNVSQSGQPAAAAYQVQNPMPPKPPAKTTLKALPTVRDHTTDQLNSSGDEYLPREVDDNGEKKVAPNGTLTGEREYKCRTFLVPNRGDRLFMLATECARVLGYRDSYLLFNKNRSLYKIIASQEEKDDLVSQDVLPFSYRSRQIAIVTARSMFRQFGSRVIVGGRRVRDDYWENKARKQGFTEADAAGEKRPGGGKVREANAAAEAAAAAVSQNNVLLTNAHPEIVYSSTPGQFPTPSQPAIVQQDLGDTRNRDFSGILKGGPRQEITGPPYTDNTRSTPLSELHTQAQHAADFNRSVNHQRDIRNEYVASMWRKPHDQGPSQGHMSQAVGSTESTLPLPSRTSHSPHAPTAGITPSGMLQNHSPHLMMNSSPYSQPQSISTQSSISQTPIRGMDQSSAPPKYGAPTPSSAGTAGAMGAPAAASAPPASHQGYSYPSSNQVWGQSPSSQQSPYPSYTTTQGQQPSQAHPSPSTASRPAPPPQQLRHPGTGQIQPGMQFPGMPSIQGYAHGQGMYADQTPRHYMPQSSPSTPAVTQGWGTPQTPAQWWTSQPQ